MTKLNDDEILVLQQEVETKKERLNKLKSRFAPETTCIFNSINLHTKNIEGLLDILSTLISSKECWDKACEMSKIKIEYRHQNHSFEQWKSDILFLIDKHNIKSMEIELDEDIQFLNGLVSKETKDKQKFDKIREKYKS